MLNPHYLTCSKLAPSILDSERQFERGPPFQFTVLLVFAFDYRLLR